MKTPFRLPLRVKQRGSGLLILMLLMFFVVTAGVGLASLQLTNSKAYWVHHDANQAYYVAEGGIEDGLARRGEGSQTFQGAVRNTLGTAVVGRYSTTVTVQATESVVSSVGYLERDPSYTCTLQVKLDNATGLVLDWRQL